MDTIAELLLARAGDGRLGMVADDRRWTWREVVAGAGAGAGLLAERRAPGPFPRGHPPRQRGRARAVARRRRPVGGRGRGGQPHAPRVRPRPGPGPHRVSASGHRPRPSSARRRARPGPGHRHGVGRRAHACWWWTIPPTGPPSSAHDGDAPSRPGRGRGHPREPRLPHLHLGHVGRAQGVPLHPGTPGPHRDHHRPDVLHHRRRRLLRVDAPVPLQRPHGGAGAGPRRGRHRGPSHRGAVLGVGIPARRAPPRRHVLQLRGQAPVVHPRHPGAPRRRGQPPGARVRQRGRRGRHRTLRRTLRLRGRRQLRVHRGRCVGAAHAGHAARCAGPRSGGDDGRRPCHGPTSARWPASTTTACS